MTTLDAAPAEAKDTVVRTVVEIAATPDDVFEALTNPHDLALWLGDHDDYAARTWSPVVSIGDLWEAPAQGPDGVMGDVRGEFLAVDAPRRLVTSWYASWDDYARTNVVYELEPVRVNGVEGTRLTVIHTLPASPMQHASQFGAIREVGWNSLLARLARLMNERLTV